MMLDGEMIQCEWTQAVVLINAVHRFWVQFMYSNTATVWVQIWDHHQAAEYKLLNKKQT